MNPKKNKWKQKWTRYTTTRSLMTKLVAFGLVMFTEKDKNKPDTIDTLQKMV